MAPVGGAVWPEQRPTDSVQVLSRPLAWLALALVLLEIAGRRLGLWGVFADLRASRRRKAQAIEPSAAPSVPPPKAPGGGSGSARRGRVGRECDDALSSAKERATRRTSRHDG